MGGPAFSTTVEIHMQAHEDTAISTAAPKVLKKFVDGIYSILKCAHFKTFSIKSTNFIKTLCLLCRRKLMEN